MKNWIFTLIIIVACSPIFAQSNDYKPKWENGQFWKITCHTVSPDDETMNNLNGEVSYYTTITDFLWEVIEITDSTTKFSVLPINIDVQSENQSTIEDANYTVYGFSLLKETSTPLIYEVDNTGNIIQHLDDHSSTTIFKNDSALKQLFIIDYEKYVEEEEYSDEAPIEFEIIKNFFGGILESIHAPFTKTYTSNHSVDLSKQPNEKWKHLRDEFKGYDKYIQFKGNESLKTNDDKYVIDYSMGIEYSNAMKQMMNEQLKITKDKKQKKNIQNQLKRFQNAQILLNVSGFYELEKANFTPIKFVKTNDFTGKMVGEKLNFKTTTTLTFQK